MFSERPKIEITRRIANSYNKRTVMILYIFISVCVRETERERRRGGREGGRDERERCRSLHILI